MAESQGCLCPVCGEILGQESFDTKGPPKWSNPSQVSDEIEESDKSMA